MFRFYPWATVGFTVGALAGFAWGKATRSNINEHVTTEVAHGVVTVAVLHIHADLHTWLTLDDDAIPLALRPVRSNLIAHASYMFHHDGGFSGNNASHLEA